MTNASSILSSLGLPSCTGCQEAPDSPLTVSLSYKPAEGAFEEYGCGECDPSCETKAEGKAKMSSSTRAPPKLPALGNDNDDGDNNSIGDSSDADAVKRWRRRKDKAGGSTVEHGSPSGKGGGKRIESPKRLERAETAETQASSMTAESSSLGCVSVSLEDSMHRRENGDDDDDDEDEEDDLLRTEEEEDECKTSSSSLVRSVDLPSSEELQHERWAVAAPDVDLSGSWTLIVSETFKKQYGRYLTDLGFGYMVRSVALKVIGRTTERTAQADGGRSLTVRGTNPRGVWERTLVASGYPDLDTRSHRREGTDYVHGTTSVVTADGEDVKAEAWWERGGTVHRSWLRGGTKYGGGDFESVRYLEEGREGAGVRQRVPSEEYQEEEGDGDLEVPEGRDEVPLLIVYRQGWKIEDRDERLPLERWASAPTCHCYGQIVRF